MKEVNNYKPSQAPGVLLNANESSKKISDKILEIIKEEITQLDLNRYPEDESKQLVEAYAKYCGKRAKQIIAGNGSDELLGLLIGLNIGENKKLYTFSLDFSMYDYYVSMHNGEMLKYDFKVEDKFDVDAFIKKGKEENVDMILFSNPNNPTGKCIDQKDILKIVEAFKDKYVIVDEAYGDFHNETMLDYIDTYKNLLITRTLSKAFSLAGIRCGFLIGNQETINKIKPYKVPYNVNSVTQLIGCIVLQNVEEIKNNIKEIIMERDALYNAYLKIGRDDLKLYDSCANYLYGKASNKEKLLEAFKEKKIFIRNYNDDSFRITIGSNLENKLVLEVLQSF